jgi:hypothetical protein
MNKSDEIFKKLGDGYYNKHPGEYDEDMIQYIMQRLPTDNRVLAQRIYNDAWEEGHSYGYNEVFIYINDRITFVHDIDLIRKRGAKDGN